MIPRRTPMRRTPMRRTGPIRPRPRRNRPPVDWDALRRRVLARDGGMCFLARIDTNHSCATRWGDPHGPYDADLLTLDHVKPEARMGVKADDVDWQMVAMCGAGNNKPPSAEERALERLHLAEHHPAEWAALRERDR